ncbi:MAG: translation initiation factor IF-3 [Candidatus Spechtbacterales bacterium]|nr:translation initiation factor IF-3 [Candidatus Spechtbacterales bacterium]
MGRRNYSRSRRRKNQPRKNEQIRAQEVRVIDDSGENIGVMPPEEAIEIAKEKGLDLVEISGKANPPVTRIMEYGKYVYQQEKKEREAKKKQQTGKNVTKGVRISMTTSDHDMETKASMVDKFLKKGYKVKVEIIMRGREKALKDRANNKLNDFLDFLTEEYTIEQKPKRYPRGMQMMIQPNNQ